MADSKKSSFSISPILIIFFTKISGIGPWVSIINWCEVHWCGSTYIVIRLSDVSLMTIYYIKGLRINLSYIPMNKSLKFSQNKKVRINVIEKLSFFVLAILIFFTSSSWNPKKNFFFYFIPMKISPNFHPGF